MTPEMENGDKQIQRDYPELELNVEHPGGEVQRQLDTAGVYCKFKTRGAYLRLNP